MIFIVIPNKCFFVIRIISIISTLFLSHTLCSQNREIEKKKIADNKIKTSTCYRCEFVFGKPDSCKILWIRKYDNKGNEIELISSPGETYSLKHYYIYDVSGKQIEYRAINQKDTTVWKTEYNSIGRKAKVFIYKNSVLTSIYTDIYENDNLISSTGYDTKNNLIYLSKSKYDKNGNRVENLFFNGKDTVINTDTYFYDNNKISKHINLSNNTVTEYFYEHDTVVLKRYINQDKSIREEEFQYDDKLRVVQIIYRDSGKYNSTRTINYQYDNRGNKIEEINTDSKFPNNYPKIHYEYDSADNLIAVLRPHDPQGKTSKAYFYNDKQQLIKMIYLPSNNDTVTYHYSYDEIGNKIQEIKKEHPLTFINEYDYNSKGFLKKENNYITTTDNNSKVLVQSIEYEYNSSQKISRATYKNFQMELLYQKYKLQDSTGKLPEKNPEFSTLIYSTTYKYDENNNLIEQYEEKDLHKSKGNNIHPHKYYYNEKNKLIENRTYYPNTETLHWKSVYEYDNKGNLIIEKKIIGGKEESLSNIIYFYYDSDNKLIDEFSYPRSGKETGHKKYIYDSTGKIIEEKTFSADGDLMKYIYDNY